MTVVNTVPPALTGTAQVGRTLITSNGTWTYDLEYLAYSYAWLRCDAAGANCVAIAGQDQPQYLITATDIGHTLRSQVTATEGDYPDPPPVGDAYFVSDWSTGMIGYLPWATIFSYTPPGYLDVGYYGNPPVASSPDGRVAVVSNPYGAGNVLKCELRNNDPYSSTLAKAELGSVESATWNGNFSMGMEIWITMEIYLPNEFSMASGGPNPFMVIGDLHPRSGSGIPALNLGGYSSTNIQLAAGLSPNTQRINFIPIIPANRNRRLDVVIGAKISNTAGWVEAWLDGVNTIPRRYLSMASSDESGPYWKQGLYSHRDSTFVGGASIIYFGTTTISATSPI